MKYKTQYNESTGLLQINLINKKITQDKTSNLYLEKPTIQVGNWYKMNENRI